MKHKKTLLTLLVTLLLFSGGSIHAEQESYINPYDLDKLELSSKNYILVDLNSNQVLDSQNPHDTIYPASITKTLTLITAIEMLEGTDLETTNYKIPEEVFIGLDSDASLADLVLGESYSLSSILYSINLPSGADATRAISMYLTATPEGLVENMNSLAQKIGMKDTHFVNTSGLDDLNHVTTVYDLSLLIQYALKNPTFKKIYTTDHYEYYNVENQRYILLNKALKDAQTSGFNYMVGAKSGYTDLSERSLSSIASKDDMNLLFISTNAPYVYNYNYAVEDAIKVYNYIFDNFKPATIPVIDEENAIFQLDIHRGSKNIPVTINNELPILLPNQAEITDLHYQFIPNFDTYEAPIEQDTLLGQIDILYENQLLTVQTLTAQETIKVHWVYQIIDFILMVAPWIIGTLVILIIIVLILRNNYRRKRRKSHMQALNRRY